MSLAAGGVPYGFNYVAADQQTGLHVQATIYDITAGSPGIQTAQVPLFPMPGSPSPGSYGGIFTPVAGKVYAIVSMVYLDSGFTTLDPNRAPGCETVQVFNFTGGGGSVSTFGIQVPRGVIAAPEILRGRVITPPILRGKIYP